MRRNIHARKGDCDSLELDGWACEVKRCESWQEAYWDQAMEQAKKHDRRPVLFFRASRRPWVAMVDLSDICALEMERDRYRVQLTLEGFTAFVREELAAIEQSRRLSASTPIPPANGKHVRPEVTA